MTTAAARRLLQAARLLLAWDDTKTTVPSFDTMKGLVGQGAKLFNLLKQVSDHVYKDLHQHTEATTKALSNAYIGSSPLKHGLPQDLVNKTAQETLKSMQKLVQASIREGRKYDKNSGDILGNALSLVPLSTMVASEFKAAQKHWKMGTRALKEAQDAVPKDKEKGASARVAINHNIPMIKTLLEQVLPYLASEHSDGKHKERFPAQDMQNMGIDASHHVLTFVREGTLIDTDLLSSYRVASVDSLRNLLIFQFLSVSMMAIETLVVHQEQKAKTYVQTMLPQMRDKQKVEKEDAKKTNESKEAPDL